MSEHIIVAIVGNLFGYLGMAVGGIALGILIERKRLHDLKDVQSVQEKKHG